jgi:NAD(P)-dependent dehydrogenase (short-subunit alcohol dehydrogenase family)
MRFTNKVVVVTGAGAGIARATAQAFAREGAHVVAVDKDSNTLEQLVADIRAKSGSVQPVVADVSNSADTQRIAQTAVDTFGGIDFLCNIAGVQTYGTVVDTDEALWDFTLDVNLKSIFLVSKYCIPEIAKRGGGAVVNVASVQGIASQRRVVAYAAAKGAAIAMSRTMALDHAPQGIRVNCVCPGSVDTPSLRFAVKNHDPLANPEEVLKQWGEHHPIGRVGQADELAKVFLFLCSDDSSFMTGSTVVVDGGLISQIL